MIALRVLEVGEFMTLLLAKNTFDKFYLCEGRAETFTSFQFGGKLNKEYYTPDEWELLENREYPYWGEVRPFVYQIIRGKKLPVNFKLVFSLSRENTEWLLSHVQTGLSVQDVRNLFLNIHYEKKGVTCITGTSLTNFTMDKTVEELWDQTAEKFFKQNKIAVERI